MISSFSGKYRFLSNFWSAKVTLDGKEYKTVEHAYQAAKTFDENIREEIRQLDKPGQTKKIGKKLKLRPDWENVKLSIMEDLVEQKFQDPQLKQLLLDTGSIELVEGNTWGDTYWGVCNGIGENHLGKILMKIREKITHNS